MASVEYTVQPTQKIGGSLIIQEITQALDQLPDHFDLQRAPPDMSKKELFYGTCPPHRRAQKHETSSSRITGVSLTSTTKASA